MMSGLQCKMYEATYKIEKVCSKTDTGNEKKQPKNTEVVEPVYSVLQRTKKALTEKKMPPKTIKRSLCSRPLPPNRSGHTPNCFSKT